MRLTLLNQKILSNIPSASGIEITGDKIYVIGDDSPCLFRLNEKFEVQEKIPIGDVKAAVNGKIPKPLKLDLEAMAAFGEELLLFGSGSKSPQRDVLVRVNIDSKKVIRHSLAQFYDGICTAAKMARADLNLEAAVILREKLLLFNRGKNFIFRTDVKKFLAHTEHGGPIPAVEIFRASLPSLNGIEAGFSGAALTPDKNQIAFCASVENTPNWIDDGEILGSFVGVFSPDELNNLFRPLCVPITDKGKNIVKIKAEAMTVQSVIGANMMRVLIATDNDESGSGFLEGELEW